tara:strand:- start:3049 stop:3435 length:387 start_codon:yes stop_codon:yes gene_type:complete
MEGPYYETEGPNREYVYLDIMLHFKNKLNDKNISYSVMNLGYLSLLIKEKMAEEFDHFGGFGSYRGYSTFTRRTIIENIMDKIKTRKIAIAYHKLCNSRIMHVLKDSVLYKPGTKRVKKLEEKFNSLK